jgi:hypothetical protein
MALFKNIYEWEVSRYQLSFLEQDALNNFSGKVTTNLIRELRGAVMVFQNILYELWSKGLRLRIAPKGKKFTEIAECAELSRITNKKGECVYNDPNLEGFYWHRKKLFVVKEERITKPDASNSKFTVFIHEFAHAIWFLVLDDLSKAEVLGIYLRACRLLGDKVCQGSEMYRNESEFFAYGFQQFVLPHRQGKILDIRKRDFGFGTPIIEIERELMAADKESLKKTNIELFEFMERRFKDIIVPEFIMPRKESPTSNDLVLKDLWLGTGLYEEIIHLG